MAQQHSDPQRIEDVLHRLRQELDGLNSVQSHVEERIAAISPKTARPVRAASLAVGVCVLALGVGCWWALLGKTPVASLTLDTPTHAAAPLKLEFGDTELVQHVAAIVDRAVV